MHQVLCVCEPPLFHTCYSLAGRSGQTHLLFVEPHLAAGEDPDHDVHSGCYEAVVAHLVVCLIHPLRVATVETHNGKKDNKTGVLQLQDQNVCDVIKSYSSVQHFGETKTNVHHLIPF